MSYSVYFEIIWDTFWIYVWTKIIENLNTIPLHSIPLPNLHVNNSQELEDKLSDMTVPDGYIFVSLNVNSLFTNISLEKVLNSRDRRISHIWNKCKIPFDELRECVEFLYKNTIFTFNKKVYKQIFGSPMGSLLSSLLADIVMNDMKTDCLLTLKNNFDCTLIFYFRYFDDILPCIKAEKLNTFMFLIITTHIQAFLMN